YAAHIFKGKTKGGRNLNQIKRSCFFGATQHPPEAKGAPARPSGALERLDALRRCNMGEARHGPTRMPVRGSTLPAPGRGVSHVGALSGRRARVKIAR